MTGFYASMMFIGILLIIVSLVLIFLDKWKSSETEKRIDQKREELAKIIADADLMVQELNKFSDYIISQVEQKNKETLDLIKNAEERLEKLTKEYASASMDSGNEKFVTNTEDSYAGGKSDLVIENLKFEEDAPVSAADRKSVV